MGIREQLVTKPVNVGQAVGAASGGIRNSAHWCGYCHGTGLYRYKSADGVEREVSCPACTPTDARLEIPSELLTK